VYTKKRKTASLYKNRKYFCRAESDTHNLKQADRVKNYECTEIFFVGWKMTHTIQDKQTGLKQPE
jgi:hypothetical protein